MMVMLVMIMMIKMMIMIITIIVIMITMMIKVSTVTTAIGVSHNMGVLLAACGELQYEPKNFCLPGGSRQAPLSAGVSFCLQTGVSGALLTPQYGTPSMRADGN